MIKSKFNNITPLTNGEYAIWNPLSGAFDIADLDTLTAFEAGRPRSSEEKELWLSRGYFFNSQQDQNLYIMDRKDNFDKISDENQIQFLLVLSYACNFGCSYCYQRGIENHQVMTMDMLEAFISFVINYRNKYHKKVIISLFGGEPLLAGKKFKDLISYLVKRINEENIPLTVVTNGYNLDLYLPIISKTDLREIHISFDGDKIHHDMRRITKDGKKSFEKIIQGIKLAVKQNIPINARIIVDRKNIDSLPNLAKTFDELGWLDLPKSKFKVALGRNYDLIENYVYQEDLFSLDELNEKYVDLLKNNAILKKMYIPEFYGITKMITTGELYAPSFDTCPAGKSEFVGDASGRIFGCTASCGREGYELGRFYPELIWYKDQLKEWQERSILTIEKCDSCSVAVVCGGGCGVIAKDRTGKAFEPNCKPVKQVMDIGIRYYEKILLGEKQ